MWKACATLLLLSACGPEVPLPDAPWGEYLSPDEWGALCQRHGLTGGHYDAHTCRRGFGDDYTRLAVGAWTITEVTAVDRPSFGGVRVASLTQRQPLEGIQSDEAADIFVEKYSGTSPKSCAAAARGSRFLQCQHRNRLLSPLTGEVTVTYERLGPDRSVHLVVKFTHERAWTYPGSGATRRPTEAEMTFTDNAIPDEPEPTWPAERARESL